MKHSISPYPSDVRVNAAGHVFKAGKYIGYVDKVDNWGANHLARCENGKPNKFFSTRTEAVLYMIAE